MGSDFPLASQAYPERKGNEVQIQAKGVFSEIKQIVFKFSAWWGIFRDVYRCQTGQTGSRLESVMEASDFFVINTLAVIIG